MVEGNGDGAEPISGNSGSSNWWASFHRDILAGAVMGGVVHTIVAPIERAKLLLQTQDSNIAILAGPHKKFKGMVDCIVRTVREEGFLSLWRGNGSSVIRYYPSVALNFSLKVLPLKSCISYNILRNGEFLLKRVGLFTCTLVLIHWFVVFKAKAITKWGEF